MPAGAPADALALTRRPDGPRDMAVVPAAPWFPPARGALPTSAGGWVLMHAARLVPQMPRQRATASMAGAAVGGFLLALVTGGSFDAVMATLAAAVAGAAGLRIVQEIKPSRWPRRASHLPGLDEADEGARVRIVGTVRPEEGFVALVTGDRVVLASYQASVNDEWAERRTEVEQVRGADFSMDVDGVGLVTVATRHADAPVNGRQATGAVDDPLRELHLARELWKDARYTQSVIGPGDQVEVVGRLERVPDPRGRGSPGRGLRLVPRIVGTPDAPVIVRRLGRPSLWQRICARLSPRAEAAGADGDRSDP